MGGGGGHGSSEKGHHHGESTFPYEIPDWRKYKVEDIPELMAVQEKLAEKGLKDPWLRNEVWRYDPGFGTVGSRARVFFLRGWKVGVAAFALTIAGEKLYDMYYPPEPSSAHGAHDH